MVISGGLLQLGIGGITAACRKCPGHVDIPDDVVAGEQICRRAGFTHFAVQRGRISVSPRRGHIDGVDRPDAHVVHARINSLNGKTLRAGLTYVNPVAVVFAPLRGVIDRPFHFVPGRLQRRDGKPLRDMVNFCDHDICRRLHHVGWRDSDRC